MRTAFFLIVFLVPLFCVSLIFARKFARKINRMRDIDRIERENQRLDDLIEREERKDKRWV